VGPPWASVPARNQLLHGFLCVGHSSCLEPAPAWAFHGLQAPSGHVSLLQRGVLHGLQGGCLLQRGPPWAAGGQPTSPWSTPWAAGEFLLQHLEHLFPFLPHEPWCLQGCFSKIFFHSSLSQLLSSVFHPFFNTLSQRIHQHLCRVQLWAAAVLPRSQVELTLSNTGADPGLVSQKPPLQFPYYQNLDK